MKTLTVNLLSTKSLKETITALGEYKKQLEDLPGKIIEAAANRLQELIEENAVEAGYTGKVEITSISKDGAEIALDGEAEFVEFGTGIVGEQNHAGIMEEWLSKLAPPYNVGWNTGKWIRHPENGKDYWLYKGEPDEYSEPYRKKEGLSITSGRPAHPFIYESVTQLEEEFVELAKKVARENGF